MSGEACPDCSRGATIGLAGLLGVCCVSLSTVVGGGALAAGVAGATAVTTGAPGVRGLAVTLVVTAATLLPLFLVWRWRAR